jgi:hypothetical protein
MNPENLESSIAKTDALTQPESPQDMSFEPNDVASQMLLIKPEVEPTGDAQIDAALDRMRDVSERPTAEHVEVFEEVHRRMQDLLVDSSQ